MRFSALPLALLRVLLGTVAIMSGVGALIFGLMVLYFAARGQSIAPADQLAMLGGLTVIAFASSMHACQSQAGRSTFTQTC